MGRDFPNLKVLIIIQARMGSSRLPGKSMMKILDKPVLGILVERLKKMTYPARIVVATTEEKSDLPIVEFCKQEKIDCFRGSENDVLDRYLKAARHFSGDVIVRLTGDCPLMDPHVVDRAIYQFLEHYPHFDYYSNTLKRTFPRGLDVEVFKRRVLEKAHQEAFYSEEREHVTPYIWRHPDLFNIGTLEFKQDVSSYRLTLDTKEDLALITKVFEGFSKRGFHFSLEDIVELLNLHPEWLKLNQDVKQKRI